MQIENSDYRQEVLDLENPYDVKMVDGFLTSLGFDYNPEQIDYTMILYNLNDELIGTGSLNKNVLKFVAVSPKFRETSSFAQIVTHLTKTVLENYKTCFVFTKPENKEKFEGVGYNEIATALPIYCLLEFGYHTIEKYKEYLVSQKKNEDAKSIASIVVNCNPFTNGHKYLIEKAASENDLVYLFVVEEDRSVFSFEVRWKLIKNGISHLKNVIMLKGGKYIVSSATFPAYFLKGESVDLVIRKQTELDITVFAKHFVPLLGINRRYVGTENYCATTAAYNEAMKSMLGNYRVELIEVQRKTTGSNDNYISASKVRKAIKESRLEDIANFLPETTMAFLKSDESAEIRLKIIESNFRH